MQTILVTGANGFVGSHFIAEAVHQFRLIATSRGDCRFSLPTGAIYESLDFTDEERVRAILQQYRPDVILHSGAMSKPDDCEKEQALAYKINTRGTEILLNEAAKLRSHFIFLSTDFIFDGEKGMYREEDLPGPVNFYGETKLAAEAFVRSYAYDWTIVRTVLVYGHPGPGRDNLLTMVAKNLREGKPLRIFHDQVRTPTFINDLVNGLMKIVRARCRGIYHLSGKDVYTPYEMAIAVAEHLQLDASLVSAVTENEFVQPARRPLKTGFDISKAERELGYKATPFIDGLKATFAS